MSAPAPLKDWRRLTKGKGAGSRSLGRTVNWATEVPPTQAPDSHCQDDPHSTSGPHPSPTLIPTPPTLILTPRPCSAARHQVPDSCPDSWLSTCSPRLRQGRGWGTEGLSRYAARDRPVSFQEEEYGDVRGPYSDMNEENAAHCEGPRAKRELQGSGS